MSLLAEVLFSAEKIEIDQINQKVPELKLSIEKIKSELVEYTDNVYIKYSGRPKENRSLLRTAHNLEEEIGTLHKHAENVTKKELLKSNKELGEHIDTLKTIDLSLKLVLKLCEVNEKLIEYTTLQTRKEYLKCKQIICYLEDTLDAIPQDEQLQIVEELKGVVRERRIGLINEIENVFKQKIIIDKDDSVATIKIISVTDSLEQALLAMFYNESVIFVLSNLAKFLWNNFFIPIVDNIVDIKCEQNEIYFLIKLEIIDNNKKSVYNEVFSNLKILLEFLENLNFPLSSTFTTLEYIGCDIRDNLSELLIKHCLEDTIPSTVEGLKNYKVVIEETEKLEETLRQHKMFAENTTSLIEYASNIDILFINKKCKEYSVESEQIMKKDLHNLTEVGVPYNPDNPLGCEVDQFLQCCVSKNVLELLNYCEKILQTAIKGTDVNAGRLLVTVQNIFRNYTKFVPEYHNKMLKTIPQQVALFHNNCLYISHKLTEWNGIYLMKLPSTLNISSIDFEVEICQLRQTGSELFSSYVKGQINQINEIMKGSGLVGDIIKELQPVTEKCVKQCLRQQELLRTVWHKVLSYSIYNKTIGIILNSLCNCLIKSITNFNDISSVVAEQLVEVIQIVLSRGPKLFTNSREISIYVPLWYKLNEISFVLNSNLIDINDRWADGKGPLALQFKPLELKKLIIALFKASDRRDAMLAKIQD
ncbi:centromere/kinetochore protein zw10 homolog [Diorhabda sublineata]|uniref:centromere/kinetochore protein zw10 homolog n=1 Tax=Diorhabda sublineata TaxID=1163346 RepID=UPI0024E0BB6D|nr:centromere/kinetochore protein zw10 homolog [Diorhabda sublineata]